MDWHLNVLTLIDLRSFSNLWFWIALAAVWSSTSHVILGAPWDLVQRAARRGGQPMADVEAMVAISVRRSLSVTDASGVLVIALACFLISLLFFLGFVYDIEFAQAVFLILLPLGGVMALRLRAAGRLRADPVQGAALVTILRRQRLMTQIIALAAIFVTAMWGMYQNLSIGVLGG